MKLKKKKQKNEKLKEKKEKIRISSKSKKLEFNEEVFFEELRKKIEMKTENYEC
jgi:hypothetical protein